MRSAAHAHALRAGPRGGGAWSGDDPDLASPYDSFSEGSYSVES
jgi:hypothetical protein